MPALIVFDFDGTLASNHHRVPYLHHQAPGYDAWIERVKQDQPNHKLLAIARNLKNEGYDVQVWTARPEFHRHTTLAWLWRHRLQPSVMRM
ncbi:MAG: hypothetical protein OXF98_01990, partial [Rhodospirillaceae bacterium]|nr:hypothetical protein [Rhodospirillaceae bacterium]